MDYPPSLERLEGRILGVGNVEGIRRRDINFLIVKGFAGARARLLIVVVVVLVYWGSGEWRQLAIRERLGATGGHWNHFNNSSMEKKVSQVRWHNRTEIYYGCFRLEKEFFGIRKQQKQRKPRIRAQMTGFRHHLVVATKTESFLLIKIEKNIYIHVIWIYDFLLFAVDSVNRGIDKKLNTAIEASSKQRAGTLGRTTNCRTMKL